MRFSAFAISFAFLVMAHPAAAERKYVDRIPNGEVNDCDNCHDDDSFHDDWDRLGWGKKLARKDSDGDGFTNGEELQDPNGRWSRRDARPGDPKLVSNPGDKRSIPGVPGAPTKKKARCIRELNRGLIRVAAAAGVELRACVEQTASGEGESTPSECAAGIEATKKVAKRVTRLEGEEADRCLGLTTPPAFGATSAADVTAAAIDERVALLEDLFGDDPDSAIVTASVDPAAARCQAALLDTTDACASLALESFEKCKAKGLETRHIGGVEGLLECLEKARSGKRDARCGDEGTKLAKAVRKRCDDPGLDLAEVFPGCGEAAPDDLVACVGERLRCRACLAVDRADDLATNCDLFDDGSEDESCGD